MSPDKEWTPEECSKKVRREAYEEHIVEQYVDSINKTGQTFSLYYFVKDGTFKNKDKPVILFAAGGPGQMVLTSAENFCDILGYRVVYFHLRGTGFSQLPANISFDQYLRTDFVVQDIEAIRRDLLDDGQWLAIIGHSYGAVVAQSYARQCPQSVKKVVLSAPITPVTVSNGKGLSQGSSDGPKPLDSLRRIYEGDFFAFLDDILVPKEIGPVREYIVRRGEDIVKEVERLYWNTQFVADEYNRLEEDLKKHRLDIGVPFFSAIRRLRLCGWLPIDVPLARGGTLQVDTTQRDSGLMIADALLKKLPSPLNLTAELKRQIETTRNRKKKTQLKTTSDEWNNINQSNPIKNSQNTARAYYVIMLYDGLNVKFLRELERNPDVKKAVQSIGGENSFNPFLEKAARALTKRPDPWDPKTKSQALPTLILKGGADPLNERGEAEYYFNHGLTGERALFEFPGTGHSMMLPNLLNQGAGINQITVDGVTGSTTNIHFLDTRGALIHAFLTMKHADFKKAKILTEIEAAFKKALDDFEKNRLRSNKPGGSAKLWSEPLPRKFWPE